MAAQLSLAAAHVHLPGAATPAKGSLAVRRNTATLRVGARVLAESEGVVSVQADSPARGNQWWTVTFADGSTWRVQRDRDCGCR